MLQYLAVLRGVNLRVRGVILRVKGGNLRGVIKLNDGAVTYF